MSWSFKALVVLLAASGCTLAVRPWTYFDPELVTIAHVDEQINLLVRAGPTTLVFATNSKIYKVRLDGTSLVRVDDPAKPLTDTITRIAATDDVVYACGSSGLRRWTQKGEDADDTGASCLGVGVTPERVVWISAAPTTKPLLRSLFHTDKFAPPKATDITADVLNNSPAGAAIVVDGSDVWIMTANRLARSVDAGPVCFTSPLGLGGGYAGLAMDDSVLVASDGYHIAEFPRDSTCLQCPASGMCPPILRRDHRGVTLYDGRIYAALHDGIHTISDAGASIVHEANVPQDVIVEGAFVYYAEGGRVMRAPR